MALYWNQCRRAAPTMMAWHRQLAAFADDYRPFPLDLRGHNLSDKPDGIASIVDDVRRVLETLSPDRPAIVVGHDWGGAAAGVLLRESPELLARMVITNAPTLRPSIAS